MAVIDDADYDAEEDDEDDPDDADDDDNPDDVNAADDDDAVNPDANFIPVQTFSGSIDEFRFYHQEKREDDIKKSMFKNVFGGNHTLRGYFKFKR